MLSASGLIECGKGAFPSDWVENYCGGIKRESVICKCFSGNEIIDGCLFGLEKAHFDLDRLKV